MRHLISGSLLKSLDQHSGNTTVDKTFIRIFKTHYSYLQYTLIQVSKEYLGKIKEII
jgi:hypothetical protein